VNAELIDENGNVVPDADRLLKAEVTGAAELLGFGSGNPITDENYSKGRFTSYQGKALAVLRSGYEAGQAKLTVSAEGLEKAEITLPLEEEK
jgi:beta-galactosidase